MKLDVAGVDRPSSLGGPSGATQRFNRCLFAEVPNCQEATMRVTNMCGLGLRKSSVKSRLGPGCIAAFFTGEGLPPLPLPQMVSTPPSKRQAAPGSSGPKEAPAQPKRRRTAEAESGAVVTLPTRGGADRAQRPPPSLAGKADDAGVASAGAGDEEEIYFKQVRVLETRLKDLLPRLKREDLSTSFVQARLEEFMKKPYGRLDKFKLEIARVWRSYLEDNPAISHPRFEDLAVDCD